MFFTVLSHSLMKIKCPAKYFKRGLPKFSRFFNISRCELLHRASICMRIGTLHVYSTDVWCSCAQLRLCRDNNCYVLLYFPLLFRDVFLPRYHHLHRGAGTCGIGRASYTFCSYQYFLTAYCKLTA